MAPDPVLYFPAVHIVQVPSLAVEPVMPDAEALLNPEPELHALLAGEVITVHAVGPGVFLYLPAAHGLQTPSFAVEPVMPPPADTLEKALPAPQVFSAGDDMSMQDPVPAEDLYFAAAHKVHFPSFDVAPSLSAPADVLLNSLP